MKFSIAMGIALVVFSCLVLSGMPATSIAAEPKSPAESINGFRFEFPCKSPMPKNPKKGADCISALVKGDPKKTDNFTSTMLANGVWLGQREWLGWASA